MSEHECRAAAVTHGTMVISGDRGHVDTVEFKHENQEYGEFTCSCGEEFGTRDEAEEHIEEVTRE